MNPVSISIIKAGPLPKQLAPLLQEMVLLYDVDEKGL